MDEFREKAGELFDQAMRIQTLRSAGVDEKITNRDAFIHRMVEEKKFRKLIEEFSLLSKLSEQDIILALGAMQVHVNTLKTLMMARLFGAVEPGSLEVYEEPSQPTVPNNGICPRCGIDLVFNNARYECHSCGWSEMVNENECA